MLNHRQHIASLDGLRGLAVLMVLCHHLCPFGGSNPVASLCAMLWLGVDLFFVLSGFLITGVLHDTLGQRDYFRNFYARRTLRLLPLYVAVVLVSLLANAALGGRLTLWAVPYLLYAANVIRDLGLPLGFAPKLDLSHLWSLALEEQFYLLWPLAVFLARTPRRILSLCVIGVALSVVLRFATTFNPGHFILGTPYFELPMRLDSLLLGAALAIAFRSEQGIQLLTVTRLHVLLVIAAGTLLLAFIETRHGSMFATPTVRYGYAAAAFTFTALVGLSLRTETLVARIGRLRILQSFGRYSYGLYLIHMVPRNIYLGALSHAQARYSPAVATALSLGMFVGYVLACFCLAKLSYETLERYFLKRKTRFSYSYECSLIISQSQTRYESIAKHHGALR